MAEETEEVESEEGLQMSFLDHLDELRKRLIYSAVGVAIAFAVCFGLSDKIYRILEKPVIREADIAMEAQERKQFSNVDNRADLLKNAKEGDQLNYTYVQESVMALDRQLNYTPPAPAALPVKRFWDFLKSATTESAPTVSKIAAGTTIPITIAKKGDRLVATLTNNWILGKAVIEKGTELPEVFDKPISGVSRAKLVINRVGGGFSLYMQVAMYSSIAFAIPYLLFQIWAFVSPGLYHHEKKYIFPLMTVGTLLFIAGTSFAYFIAFPSACSFLLSWQDGFQTLLTADDYLDLILLMMLGFGLVFQIPTIAFILGRIGLVTAKGLLKVWRYALVGIMIISALVTPTPDPVNMMILAAPMLGLYFISIGVIAVFGKKRQTDEEYAADAAD